MNDYEEISPDEFNKAQKRYMNTREGFLSNLAQSAKGRGKEVLSLGKNKTELPYPGTLGGQLGQIIGRGAVDVPAIAGSSFLGAAAIPALLGYGYLTSPGETSAEKLESGIMTALPKLGKPTRAGMNKIKNSISSSGEGSSMGELQKMIETLQKPNQVQEQIEGLKTAKDTANLSKKEASERLLEPVEQSIEGKEHNLLTHENQIEKIWGDASKEKMRGNVQKVVKSANDELNNVNKSNYKSFGEEFGNEPITKPINFRALERDYNINPEILKSYSDIAPLIKKLGPEPTISEKMGQPKPMNHTVNDYLNLYRALRDTVNDNRQQSRLAIGAQKAQLLGDAKKLAYLRDAVKSNMESSLSEPGKKSFKDVQDFFGNYIAKLREHNPSQSILEEGKVPNNYFDTLNQPGMDAIREFMMKQPNAKETFGLHSLMDKNITGMTPQRIIALLKEDRAQLLPNEIKDLLANYAGHKHDLGYLNKLKTEATKARIKEPNRAMKEVLQKNPELEKPFKDLKDMHKRMRELEKELIEKGLEKKEAEDAANKYWKIVATIKTIKGIKGALRSTFGL